MGIFKSLSQRHYTQALARPASELLLPSAMKEDNVKADRKLIRLSFTLVPWILDALLLVTLVYVVVSPASLECNSNNANTLYSEGKDYSPAQHLIQVETQNVVFTGGFEGGETQYQGPSTPERDHAWNDLYNFGISRVPKAFIADLKLVHRPIPIPGDPEHSLVSLYVFHQLHCLNMIRIGLWSKVQLEANETLPGIDHLSHCLDGLRQSLMCSVDITPLPWVWDAEAGEAKAVAEVQHTCRNFEKVRNWAIENRVKDLDIKMFM